MAARELSQSADAAAFEVGCLPTELPGHWSTVEGRAMAERYAKMTRRELGNAQYTDFETANAIYMVDRNDLSLIVWQTAAKERIRWLSVQLAIAQAALANTQTQAAREAVVPRAAETAEDASGMNPLISPKEGAGQ